MGGAQRGFLCTSILVTIGTLACADETVPSTDGGISQSTSSSTSGPSDSGEDTGTGEAETDTGDPDPDPDPECGNGEVEDGEACDDGNDVHDDACTNDCTAAACGDGIVQSGEECDAGANNGPARSSFLLVNVRHRYGDDEALKNAMTLWIRLHRARVAMRRCQLWPTISSTWSSARLSSFRIPVRRIGPPMQDRGRRELRAALAWRARWPIAICSAVKI